MNTTLDAMALLLDVSKAHRAKLDVEVVGLRQRISRSRLRHPPKPSACSISTNLRAGVPHEPDQRKPRR